MFLYWKETSKCLKPIGVTAMKRAGFSLCSLPAPERVPALGCAGQWCCCPRYSALALPAAPVWEGRTPLCLFGCPNATPTQRFQRAFPRRFLACGHGLWGQWRWGRALAGSGGDASASYCCVMGSPRAPAPPRKSSHQSGPSPPPA